MSKNLPTYAAFALFAAFVVPFFAVAQSSEELQNQIDTNNAQIAALEKEIAQYQGQLDATIEHKNTLQNEISQLDLQRKKIQASINILKSQINTTQLQIQQLTQGIKHKQISIENYQAGIAESLRTLSQWDQRPLTSVILSANNISDAWRDADAIASLQDSVRADIARLATEKESLSAIKNNAEAKRAQLLRQQKALVTEQGALNATRKAQSELLAETKSKESNFQSILAEKRSQEASFEQALNDLQAKLQRTLNPSQITPAGKGVIKWPLDKVRITQNFGNTAFALSGAYSGKGHNGIDLAASIGTPVKAALSGTVVGVGDTGTVRGCYSYGRWVLIKHENGLDTLYAHLSQANAWVGESVATGEVIAYSGQTGYATGPHLHFGVFVSSATSVMRLGEASNKKTPCSNAILPIVAPFSGYLNPMSYL